MMAAPSPSSSAACNRKRRRARNKSDIASRGTYLGHLPIRHFDLRPKFDGKITMQRYALHMKTNDVYRSTNEHSNGLIASICLRCLAAIAIETTTRALSLPRLLPIWLILRRNRKHPLRSLRSDDNRDCVHYNLLLRCAKRGGINGTAGFLP